MTDSSEQEPTNRLGRIAQAMLRAADEHPEALETDRAIVMLDDEAEQRGMIAHGGYGKDEGAEAFVNLMAHVQMLAEANGMRLDFVPNPNPIGEG
jgi:hypothetical protein